MDNETPFNDQPTIRLLDTQGDLVRHVSQREAGRLLRKGDADLRFELPPAIQLLPPPAEEEEQDSSSSSQQEDKGEAEERDCETEQVLRETCESEAEW